MPSLITSNQDNNRHKPWVKGTHWIITGSFLALVLSGFVIFMCHPRLYWGEVGNDLTPALLELPVSRNYQHGGWEKPMPFYQEAGAPVSASRSYEIFNQNGWGRSLHFLAAWLLVVTGVVYLLTGIFSGHIRRHLWPRVGEYTIAAIRREVRRHLQKWVPPASNGAQSNGPQYGLLQKCTYLVVIFLLLPVMVLTGLTMSPAITAAHPFLLKMFFGAQSARTIHFFASVALVLFLLVHLSMVIRSGFKRQIRAMTFGR